jgi:hypothetical protein
MLRPHGRISSVRLARCLSGTLTVVERLTNFIEAANCPFKDRSAVVVKRRVAARHAHIYEVTGFIIKTSLLAALAPRRMGHNPGCGVFET